MSDKHVIISDIKGKFEMSINKKILKRIRGHGRGYVFTPKDFLAFGSRAAVDQTLSRLARRGVIRRLDRGLYDYPKISTRLGTLSPAPGVVARAIARRTDSKVQVSGARAANALGVTDQVPAKVVYFTDGPSQVARVGNQRVILKHQSKKNLIGVGQQTGLVFQAIRYLGKDNITDDVIQKLRSALTERQRKSLQRDATRATDWARACVAKIAAAA